MKTKTYAIMVGGLFLLLIGTQSYAAETAAKQTAPAQDQQQVAEMNTLKDNQQVRAWLGSIKPAAGPVQQSTQQQSTEYWQQTVHRENRGKLQE